MKKVRLPMRIHIWIFATSLAFFEALIALVWAKPLALVVFALLAIFCFRLLRYSIVEWYIDIITKQQAQEEKSNEL